MSYSPHSDSHFIQLQSPVSEGDSLTQTYRLQSKIADLTYCIRFVSNLLSATKEIIALLCSEHFDFPQYQLQIIMLTELARKTLESTGVVLFLWASCPAHLLPHKSAYIDLLRMLQSKERYVDTTLQKRLRTLLMPLTSTFKICPPSQNVVSAGSGIDIESLGSQRRISSSTTELPESFSGPVGMHSPSMMLPPDAFPTISDRLRWNTSAGRRSSNQPLWDESEIYSGSNGRRRRSRSPHQRDNSSAEDDQENVAPESFAFQPPRASQRFGIFLTRKSSMMGNYNRKERAGRPTH